MWRGRWLIQWTKKKGGLVPAGDVAGEMADPVGKSLVPKPGNKNRDWNVGSSANQQSAK
jgi:hypothetical protein